MSWADDGGTGHGRMHDSPSLPFDDHKDVPRPEEKVVNDGQVTSPNVTGVILQESGPGLARVSTHLGHVPLYRPLADLNPRFRQHNA
jgi:hypothetical protein